MNIEARNRSRWYTSAELDALGGLAWVRQQGRAVVWNGAFGQALRWAVVA